MTDYTSREAAEKTLIAFFCAPHISESFIKADVDLIPAADVRPVVRGKWIPQLTPYAVKNADICACSVCGDSVWIYKDKSQPWNFCPNCGAQMTEAHHGSP